MEVGKMMVRVEICNGAVMVDVAEDSVPPYIADLADDYVRRIVAAVAAHGDKLIGVSEERI